MNKAKQYGLNFVITNVDGFLPLPQITCDHDSLGYSINHEIASFIEPNGIKYTQSIIDELTSLGTASINDYVLWGANEEESIEIFSPPLRAVFNTGGTEVIVPAQDLIEILTEWMIFLKSLNFKHSLSNY